MRKGTALDLVGEKASSSGSVEASSLEEAETSSKEERQAVTEQLLSSSYLDTNLSIPNIAVESFKSAEADPQYCWEPYHVHTKAQIAVPPQYTEQAAPYVKQVIEPSSSSYRVEAKLFIVHEEEEPRRFQKNVADCMGPPEKLKVDGLFESLLAPEANMTTDNDTMEQEPVVEHVEIHEMKQDLAESKSENSQDGTSIQSKSRSSKNRSAMTITSQKPSDIPGTREEDKSSDGRTGTRQERSQGRSSRTGSRSGSRGKSPVMSSSQT